MAEYAVSFAVERLGDLLIQEAIFLHRVSGQFEQMQTELRLMQSFLEDADKRQDQDKTVQAWVSEIREAAYDVEDVVETFALKIASRRRGRIQNSFKRYACIINDNIEIHKVGSKIEAIQTRISNLTRSLQTYGIKRKSEGEGSSSAHGMQRQWRRSYAHVVEEYTVGLAEDIKILVAQLVNEEENYGVVSICGMGGLGKTTLAKKVFHHNDIRRHFDGFAWAYISQQCQPRDVWEGILSELITASKEQRDEMKGLRDEELLRRLYQVQLEKKCLVILDDIWRTEAWDSLSHAFPVEKVGSKILLTTRNKEVALHVDPRCFLHEPRCLTEEESWDLLQKKAFPVKDDPDLRYRDMEKLGRKMVGRCAGLPLAIVVLGGLLATKHTLNEWNMVHENISSYLRRAKGHEQQHSGIYEVLALSYHELPYQLKPCFLHLAHFPEDFEIPTKKLVRIWVAEGIVSPMQYEAGGEETLEDVAKHYLDELMNRCMVQVGEMGSTGRVKTCRLHDLMRELCLSKANQENFLKIVHLQDRNKQVDSLSSTSRVHRLAFYLGEEPLKFFPKQERSLYLRSLLFFSTQESILREVQSRFSDFKLLKILDLEKCSIAGKSAREIGNLIHLRYLCLNCDRIPNIPSSIGNLRCLQTLILRGRGNKKVRVPNVIWKMEQLRHLQLPFNFNVKKRGGKLRLNNLSDLQKLQGFDTRMCDVKGLTELTNLKKLDINYLESFKEFVELDVTLNRLCSLYIYFSTVEETDLQRLLLGCPHLYKLSLIGQNGQIKKLPEYHQFPPNLTKLTLLGSQLEEDPMATLEKLPNLSILCFFANSFYGKEMVCSSKGFPQLKLLVLAYLPNLEEWCVGEEAMPNLCELVIACCKELKMIPDGLRFITALRKLQIIDMPVEFENRLQVVNGREGEDLYKVQHVPSIIFKKSEFD